ncbi:MAG: PhoU domain-containing protein [Candidatus Kaelpia aquatica]|nr:PhoU domain-containing protein [Candidatus Kaelpia aquatica]
MFKNIMRFWKGKDFLNQVLEDFKSMLNDAESMFGMVIRRLLYNEGDLDTLKKEIYEIDSRVNKSEKEIRKRIIEHLSIQPSVDVPTSLLLMSVVKDAERLGDYSKNLFEVSKFLAEPIDKNKYKELFNNIDQEIAELFKDTKKAFLESDEDIAIASWNYERQIAKRCDQILEKLAKSNISVNEAVCFTLIARHFKRIAAHLTNIATSVVLPLSDLDYFDESR